MVGATFDAGFGCVAISKGDAMMQRMRTTVTLDPDVRHLVERAMEERSLTFKDALNDAVRRGLGSTTGTRRRPTKTFHMGFEPALPWDKALRMAADIEDEELVRRLAVRK